MAEGTLLLNESDVDALLPMSECIAAVELAYASAARGDILQPAFMDVPAHKGEFHVKAGGVIIDGDTYFAVKESGCFFDNIRDYGLPTIYGMIIFCNGKNATPLAIMDALPITAKRTGAATAVAAKYLARKDSRVVTICGAGTQGKNQLLALNEVFDVNKVYIHDVQKGVAEKYAREMSGICEINVVDAAGLKNAVRSSDICVTCTPATEPIIRDDHLPPGIFLSAIGSDNHEKNEVEPLALQKHRLVVDSNAQCSAIGETHHAIKNGLIDANEKQPEIGEVIIGKKDGRNDDSEIIIFDATGIALQDVTSAHSVYKGALSANIGQQFAFR